MTGLRMGGSTSSRYGRSTHRCHGSLPRQRWCGRSLSFGATDAGAKGQHTQQRHREARVFIRCQPQFIPAMHGDLVIQLHFFRIKGGGQAHHIGILRQIFGQRRRHRLRQCDPVQQSTEVLQRAVVGQAASRHFIGHRQQVGAILGCQRIEQADQIRLVERAQHALHGIQRHFPRSIGNRLISQRQRIAHRTVRTGGQQPQRRRLEADALLPQNIIEVADDMAGRHLLQIELQTARQHRDRNLLRVGGRQYEFHVLGRLFQSLQHGVEGVVGQHVHLVDHIDLEACIARRVHRLFQQLRHLVHTTVGCRIHLYIVDKAARIDRAAGFAHAARGSGDTALPVRSHAIERFGQNPRQRSLAHPARTREQIGMVQTAAVQCMGQCTDYVLLTDERVEVAGAVFTGEDLIGHAGILP